MNEPLTIAAIAALKKAAAQANIREPVCFVSREAYIELRRAHDPYGIYRQRRMMSKVLPDIIEYRGDEWWH